MIIELLTYLISFFTILLPGYLVFRIWKREFTSKVTWGINLLHGMLALVFLFLIFRWDLAIYPLRYWWNGLCLAGLVSSYRNVMEKPMWPKKKWSVGWGMALELVLMFGGLAWVAMGAFPDEQPVSMEYPLKGDDYFVVHGGETPILNYHGAAAHAQKYAMDINQLNGMDVRASGFYPENPQSYAVFGDTVYSPIGGRVVQAADSLMDQHPPKTRPGVAAGNHIWIKKDSLYVLLAHLQHKSLRVKEGEQVRAGQPLARVGNTGNTTEPHLHIHAVTSPRRDKTETSTQLYGGDPVPISMEGDFLIRNNTF